MYYTQWSPPEGTLPPPGTVLPGNAPAPQETKVPEVKQQAVSVDPEIAAAYELYKIEVRHEVLCKLILPCFIRILVGIESRRLQFCLRFIQITSPSTFFIASQYKKWYDEHGKASGADPNPPPPQ